MKKTLLTLSAAMLAGMSMATPHGNLIINRGFTPPVCEDVVSQKLEKGKISLSERSRLMGQSRSGGMRNARTLKVSAETGIISEKPAGTEVQYSRDTYGYYVYWWYIMFGEQKGMAADVVYGDDGYAYIHNPFSGWTTNSYLKCEVKGDKLVATLPQAIYQEEDMYDPEIIHDFYAAILHKVVDDEGNIDYVLSDTEEIKTISWTVDGDRVTMDMEYDATPDAEGYLPYPGVMFGMVDADGVWTIAGDCAQTYSKVEYKPVVAPEGLVAEDWTLISGGSGMPVKVGFDGNDIYLKGLMDDAYVKGSVAGGKAVFQSGQYMGVYGGSVFAHFMGGTYDAESYALADNITFDYDAGKKVLASKEGDCMMINGALDRVYYIDMYENPVLKVTNANPAPKPGAPIPTGYSDYFEDYGYAYFTVDLPNLNADDDLLDTSHIYYQIYIDGEVFTFANDEYGIEEDMTDVPYAFSDGEGIFASGVSHSLYFYFTGFSTIGVRMFNVVDGKTYPSALMTLDVENMSYTIEDDPVSVVNVESGKAVAGVEYYNLQGVKVADPAGGIFVCKKTYGDGSSDVSKVIVK